MESTLDDFRGRFYCDGCGEAIELNEDGLALIYIAKNSNERLPAIYFIHMYDHCKQLMKKHPSGNWLENSEPVYIPLDEFIKSTEVVKMTEAEKCLARPWHDPRYEIIDPSDYAWSANDGFGARIERAQEMNVITQEDYDYVLEKFLLDDESTEKCHAIMVKMGLLRSIAQA